MSNTQIAVNKILQGFLRVTFTGGVVGVEPECLRI